MTSGENIGIVRVSGVRSRYVTAVAGAILILIGLVAPIGRLIGALPAPVVGGTALVVYGIITVIGVQMLRRVDLSEHGNMLVVAIALAVGMLPILIPGVYDKFPPNARILLGSGVAMGAFTAVAMNILFHHVGPRGVEPTVPDVRSEADVISGLADDDDTAAEADSPSATGRARS